MKLKLYEEKECCVGIQKEWGAVRSKCKTKVQEDVKQEYRTQSELSRGLQVEARGWGC